MSWSIVPAGLFDQLIPRKLSVPSYMLYELLSLVVSVVKVGHLLEESTP